MAADIDAINAVADQTPLRVELLRQLKGARLMQYAWKGSRAKYGEHAELDRTIREIEAVIARAETGHLTPKPSDHVAFISLRHA